MGKTIGFRKIRKQMPQSKESKDKEKESLREKTRLKNFIRKPSKVQDKPEKNHYKFTGFFERLQQIDVKHAHSSLNDQAFRFDNLVDIDSQDEDIAASNFASLLAQEKMLNKTLEFSRFFREVEPLCFSFSLLILNKSKLVTKLLDTLHNEKMQAINCAVLDLLIALMKDLRSEIFDDFMHQILPSVVRVLDGNNLPLLDKVFQLLSFAFKFLLKSVRENITAVYDVYFELLKHNNRFVRKFASQSFSYVLRKMTCDRKLLQMLLQPALNDEEAIYGLSDLLFEVMAGQSEDLHSKAIGVITELLDQDLVFTNKNIFQLVRYLALKIVNQIDTQKQSPFFEQLVASLLPQAPHAEEKCSLLCQIFNDSLQLKFGRRVSQLTVILMVETITKLINQHVALLTVAMKEKIADTLGCLYYFKHGNVNYIFQKSKHDFATHNSVFTQGVYTLATNGAERKVVLSAYFGLILQDANAISSKTDINVDKLLNLKQSVKQIEFSYESHLEKSALLVKSLARQVLKMITQAEKVSQDHVQMIALLLLVIQRSERKDFKIQVTKNVLDKLATLELSERNQFVISAFLRLASDSSEVAELAQKLRRQSVQTKLSLKINVQNNPGLQNYKNLDVQNLMDTAFGLVDLQNQPWKEWVCLNTEYSLMTAEQLLEHADFGSVVALKNLLATYKGEKISVERNIRVAEKLSKNLTKNSREIRLLSLQALDKLFLACQFLKPTEDSEMDAATIADFYTGDCNLVSILLECETLDLSFATEKSKNALVRKVQGLVGSGMTPLFYTQMSYNFLIGCLWLRFQPLHDHAQSALTELFSTLPVFLTQHLVLLQQVGHLAQVVANFDHFQTGLLTLANLTVLDVNDFETQLYAKATTSNSDSVSLRDFHYNIVKSLIPSAETILKDPETRRTLYSFFSDFVNSEYKPLHFCKPDGNLQQKLQIANSQETEEYKNHRRMGQNKLLSWLELLSKSALNKLAPTQSKELIDLLLLLIARADPKLQKFCLTCLLKVSKKSDFENKTIKLPKYAALLEGLADDQKFKDFLLVVTHGSNTNARDLNEIEPDLDYDAPKKDKEAGVIPKLAEEDRQDVLPVVVKLLFSKLFKKKGVINQKSIGTRRTIVFQFLAGLDPSTEFPIFFKELLAPLGLAEAMELEKDQLSVDMLSELVANSGCSFSTIASFIDQVEVTFKQAGSLLTASDFVFKLARFLITVLTLAKKFIGDLNDHEDAEPSQPLYRFVRQQCKGCIRKGLKVVSLLYNKFYFVPSFLEDLSQQVFTHLVQDQLALLPTKYNSERSQLVDILTLHWSSQKATSCTGIQNYLKYPDVIPSVLQLLGNSKVDSSVSQTVLQLVKNLVCMATDQTTEEAMDEGLEHDSDDMQVDQSALQTQKKELSRRVLVANIDNLAQQLHSFWVKNAQKFKQALFAKAPRQKVQSQQTSNESIKLGQSARDMTFILSELAIFLNPDSAEISAGFLEMIVSLVSNRSLLRSRGGSRKQDELLSQCCNAIWRLMSQLQPADELIKKVLVFFLDLNNKPVREALSTGLFEALKNKQVGVSEAALSILKDLNKSKKGSADQEFDNEKVLRGLESATTFVINRPLDLHALMFSILFLLRENEYSVREYAQVVLEKLLVNADLHLFQVAERQILGCLRSCKEEMVLKTVLACFRMLIKHTVGRPEYGKTVSFGLTTMLQDDEHDFFSQVLSMQIPSRAKALRKICQEKYPSVPSQAFRMGVLPLVDFLIFDTKSHMQNKRHTIRYNREHSQQLIEHALGVYTVYGKSLKWNEYFRLVRSLLYKIEKAARRNVEVSAERADYTMEKTLTKCLCKVLEALSNNNHFHLPDAVQEIEKNRGQMETNDFQKLLANLKEAHKDDFEDVELSEGEGGSDSDEEEVPDTVVDDSVAGMQAKLAKVLPVLQRHLTDRKQQLENKGLDAAKGKSCPLRSFVAVTIAQVIRKLPVARFGMQLRRLVNLIVVKGLREKELYSREKGRKALIRVVAEVSPLFLAQMFQEMQDQLTRGFQLHVYVYTVHHVLHNLVEGKKLLPGHITPQVLRVTSDLLMRELFGDLMEERELQETAKKHIKESKSRKATAIFEIYAQFMDFGSFLELLAPVIKVLEENPNSSQIQQIEDLLARVSGALLRNETLSGEQLLVVLYSVVEKGVTLSVKTKVNNDKAIRDYGAGVAPITKTKQQLMHASHGIQTEWVKGNTMAGENKTEQVRGRVLANFGLQCLRRCLKQKGLILRGDEHEQRLKPTIAKTELSDRLDPFVPLLLQALNSFHTPTLVTTLAIITQVVHLGLPSFTPLLRKFVSKILAMFESHADPDFLNALFKCAAELIRTSAVYSDLSEAQVGALVLAMRAHVGSLATQAAVFTCLKAVVHRRFVNSDVYDIIGTIQELMVTSVHRITRQNCAAIFVSFLLEYPLEPSRVEQHVHHLLKNLSYFDSEGRLQLLEVCATVISKLPLPLLQQFAELFFFTFFLRLINDSAPTCRTKIAQLLETLVERAASTAPSLLLSVIQMSSDDPVKQATLTNGKLQCLQIFAKAGLLRDAQLTQTIQLVATVVTQGLEQACTDSDDEGHPDAPAFLLAIDLGEDTKEENTWSSTYFGLCCLEAILNSQQTQVKKEEVLRSAGKELLSQVMSLVWKHGNYWVRLSAQRFLGFVFAALEGSRQSLKLLSLTNSDELLKASYEQLSVLKFPHATRDLMDPLVQNVLFLVKRVSDHPAATPTLEKICKKASYIGRKIIGAEDSESNQQKLLAIHNIYAAMIEALASDQLEACCPAMLELIWRTYNSDCFPDIKALAVTIVDSFSAKLDKKKFLELFNSTQQTISKLRTDRKMKEKLRIGTDLGQKIKANKRIKKTLKKKEKAHAKLIDQICS